MKTYGQYCGLARGLDLIGDRWSVLIIRELALGDRRYGELQRGLPGIATNLLADRLRDLAAADIIEQRTSSPSSPGAPGAPGATRAVRYALTARGRELLPMLHALVRWATPAMVAGPAAGDHEQPRWVAFAASAYLRHAPPGVSLRVVLTCGGEHIRIVAHDGAVDVTLADAVKPDVQIIANSWALMGLVSGSVALAHLTVVDPGATVSGSRRARRALQALLLFVDHNASGGAAP